MPLNYIFLAVYLVIGIFVSEYTRRFLNKNPDRATAGGFDWLAWVCIAIFWIIPCAVGVVQAFRQGWQRASRVRAEDDKRTIH